MSFCSYTLNPTQLSRGLLTAAARWTYYHEQKIRHPFFSEPEFRLAALNLFSRREAGKPWLVRHRVTHRQRKRNGLPFTKTFRAANWDLASLKKGCRFFCSLWYYREQKKRSTRRVCYYSNSHNFSTKRRITASQILTRCRSTSQE